MHSDPDEALRLKLTVEALAMAVLKTRITSAADLADFDSANLRGGAEVAVAGSWAAAQGAGRGVAAGVQFAQGTSRSAKSPHCEPAR
ncbi:MAG TPA: hypothetical protein VIM69_05645 [Opitutaceae bacterium]